MIMRRIEHYLMFGVPGRNINLEKSNEDFLENEVTLYVDKFMKHDDIHMLVKLDKMPAYYDLRHDKTKAKIGYDLFLKASEEQKINCVKEEAMVLALERYLLPQRDKDQKVALLRAMNRMGTTLTKGWFREYVVDNFYQALDKIDTDLIKIKDVIYKSNKKEEKKQVEEKKEEVGENIKDLNEDEKIMYQRILKNSTIENGIMDFEDEKYHIRIGQHFQNGFEDGGWCNRYNYWIGSLYIMNMDERMYYEEDFNPSRINVDYGGVCYKECNQNGLIYLLNLKLLYPKIIRLVLLLN